MSSTSKRTPKNSARKEENKLNRLKNVIDIWSHKVYSILDGKGEVERKGHDLGIEIVECLISIKVIQKEDIEDIVGDKYDNERIRPCSGSTPSCKSTHKVESKDFYYKKSENEETVRKLMIKNKVLRSRLQREVDSKQKDLNWYEQQINYLWDENSRLRGQILQLENLKKKDLKWYQQQIKDLRDKISGLECKISEMEKILAEKQSILEGYEEDIKCYRSKEHILIAEKEVLEQRFQELQLCYLEIQTSYKKRNQKDFNWYEQEIKYVRDENSGLEGQILQLKNLLADKQSILEGYEKELNCNKSKESVFVAEKEVLEKRIQELKSFNSKIEISYQKSLATIEFQNKYIERKKEEIEELKQNDQLTSYKRLSDIEKENVSLCNEVTVTLKSLEQSKQDYKNVKMELEKEKAKIAELIYKLQREKESFNSEKADIKRKLDQALKNLQHLSSQESNNLDSSEKDFMMLKQISVLNEDKKLLRGKIVSLEEEKRELQTRIQKLKKDCQGLQQLLQEKDDLSYKQLLQKRNDLKQSLSKISTDFEHLKKQYDLEKRHADAQLKEHNKDRDKLRKEVDSLRTENQKLIKERVQLKKRIETEEKASQSEHDKLKHEKNDLIQLLKDRETFYKDKIDRLEVEINILHDKGKRETDEEKHSENVSTKSIKEINRLMAERDQAVSDLDEMKKTHDRMQDEVDDLQKELKLCKGNSHGLQYELDEYKATVNKLRQEKTNIGEENKRLSEDNRKACSDIAKMKTKEDGLHGEIDMLKSKLKEMNTKKEKEITALKMEVENYQERSNKLEREIEDLRSRIILDSTSKTQFELVSAKYDKEKRDLQEKNEQAENEVLQLKTDKNVMQAVIDNLQLQLHTLEKDNQKLESESKDIHDTLNQLLLEKAKNEKEMNKLRQERDQAKYDLIQIRRDKSDLQSRLDVLHAENQTLIDEKEQQMENQVKKDKQKINQLKRQIQELHASLNEERQRVESIEQKNAEQMRDNDRMKINLDLIESQHRELDIEKQNRESILQDEIQSLKYRLQSFSSEEIMSLQKQVNSLSSENADLRHKYQLKKTSQEQTDQEIMKLKGDISQLQTNIITLKQEKDTLNSKLELVNEEKADLEERARRRSQQVTDPRNCQNCWKYRNEVSDLQREISDLRDRLSEAAGNRLRDNNPNIADLSDMNRPTNLADKFNSLYSDEYTDAMEVIEDEMGEDEGVNKMLLWLKTCYDWCQKIAKEQRGLIINEAVGFICKYNGDKGRILLADRCHIYVKEFQKKIALETLPAVFQVCLMKIVAEEKFKRNESITKYINKCTELCWMMQITDPPLFVNFDVRHGIPLEKDLYNVFTKNGSKIKYLVWPVLYLHENGPLLAKGVAQGM